LQRIYTDPLVEVRVEQPAGLVSRDLKTAAAFSMPSYAVMFAFFVMGTVGTTLLREKEDGTLRRLTASPIGRGAIIGGKMLGYMPVVVLQMVVVFSVGRIFFGLSFGHSPIGFLLLSLALALTPTSLGLLLATISKTPAQAGTTSMIAGILLGVLGGAVVYNPGPGLLDTIRRLLPHHYAIQGFITLSSWGGGLVDVLPYIGVLAGFGLVLFLLAVWRLKLD
jgi:ABC-2 type transport system permease protein